jgi:predicted DCC family thiol-disulfide oxidoreductase YuxK
MTAALGEIVMLFDGSCRFCTASAKQLARRGRGVKTRNFQDEGVLDAYPKISYEAAMKRMHVVDDAGEVFAGAGAVFRVFRTVPWLAPFTYIYFVPGLRQLFDIGYDLVAKYRYKLFGRTATCDGGTCHLH